jgi:DNA-binding NarL/FixJ family response regulator
VITMKVLLVDDHRVMLAGLEALLLGQPWVAEVHTATTVDEALAAAGNHLPDIAVVDLALGADSGLRLIEPLREAVPGVRVLVLTMSADHDDARDAVRRGASGYVLKDSGPDEVLAAIRMVGAGGSAFSAGPSVAVVVPGRAGAGRRLTDRERELLRLLAKGRSTDEIARTLYLSPKTVRNQLSDLYRTLGVANRTEAVVVAYELGM